MKDSQHWMWRNRVDPKYIKANNERFSTINTITGDLAISISRRIMKDSQPFGKRAKVETKYIKANNERFSTREQSREERA